MKLETRFLPYFVLAFGILAVGMAAILVRWANAPATVMGFWRMSIASLVMIVPVTLFTQHAARVTSDSSPVTRHLPLAVLAGVFFSMNLVAWNIGALTTTAANVTLLGNLTVVWVPLTALFLFKQKLRGMFWLGLVCALIGVIIILGQDLLAHPALGVGDLWAIASSFVYTVYLLAMERARAHLSALVAWWTSTTTSAIVLLLLNLALGISLTAYPLASFVVFATMAILLQIGGFLSLNFALGHLPAPIVAASMLGQPVITAFLAVPLLGQTIELIQAFGAVIVLTGIVIVHKSRQ